MHRTYGGPPRADLPDDTEDGAAACRPGRNGRGPARELARFYERLLKRGESVVTPQSAEALAARHRVGMYDHTFKHVIDWGLGFIPESSQYGAETVPYGYGPHASRRTFGHSGSQSSVAFADPEQGLAVAVICNGMPREGPHQRRIRQVLAAAYEDLGLAGTIAADGPDAADASDPPDATGLA
jgi:CubicO group peptidase (beta-lactamase class C family)